MNTEFYLKQEEPVQGTLMALRNIILNVSPEITESKKYGSPVFMYKGKNLVYLWMDKKSGHPYVLFVDGNKIDHPALIQGDRKRMKIYLVDPHKDIDQKELSSLLNKAIEIIS